jgi:Fe-S-cluster containining protein
MEKIDCFENESVNFICKKCGECCRHIEAFIAIIPHQDNGICGFLQGDLCAIYENRPDLCDYKRAYKYVEDYLTEIEYMEKIVYFCEKFRQMKKC